jgi:hypothetical protein
VPFYSEVSGNLYIYETLTVNGTGSAQFAPNVSGSAFYYGNIVTTGSSGDGGTSGWTDDGTVVRLTTATDDVAIGVASMAGSEKLRVTGETRLEGAVTITADDLSFTGGDIDLDPTGTFQMNMDSGQEIRIRLSDNKAGALIIENDGTNLDYITLDTTASDPRVTLNDGGEAGVHIKMADNKSTAFTVRQSGDDYIKIHTTNGSEILEIGDGNVGFTLDFNAGNIDLDPTGTFTLDMDPTKTVTFTLADSLDNTFRVQAGSNEYVVVDSALGQLILGHEGGSVRHRVQLENGTNAGAYRMEDSTSGFRYIEANTLTPEVVINLNGNLVDFRCETDTITNAFLVDASADTVNTNVKLNANLGAEISGAGLTVTDQLIIHTYTASADQQTAHDIILQTGDHDGVFAIRAGASRAAPMTGEKGQSMFVANLNGHASDSTSSSLIAYFAGVNNGTASAFTHGLLLDGQFTSVIKVEDAEDDLAGYDLSIEAAGGGAANTVSGGNAGEIVLQGSDGGDGTAGLPAGDGSRIRLNAGIAGTDNGGGAGNSGPIEMQTNNTTRMFISGSGKTEVTLPDNTAAAYAINNSGGQNIFVVDTTDSDSRIKIGATDDAFRVDIRYNSGTGDAFRLLNRVTTRNDLRVNTNLGVIELANSTDNQAVTQLGSGQVTFSGNVDVNSGLDVTGGALTHTGGNIDLDPTGNYTLDLDAAATAITTVADNETLGVWTIKDASEMNFIRVQSTTGTKEIRLGQSGGGTTSHFHGATRVHGSWRIDDDTQSRWGTDNDWSLTYDETADNALELVGAASPVTVSGTAFTIFGSNGGAASGGVTAGPGGFFTWEAGAGGNSVSGANNTAGTGGAITIAGGTGGTATNSQHDGAIGGITTLRGGTGGAGNVGQNSGQGGLITIAGGNAGADGGGTQANGGAVSIAGGSGLAGGNIDINAGSGSGGGDGDINIGSSNCDNLTMISRAAFDIQSAASQTQSFRLRESSNEYINLDTTVGSEVITFGNASTNPSFLFSGGGPVEIVGHVVAAVNVNAQTSTYNITELESRTVYTNEGATDDLNIRPFNLPSASADVSYQYTFIVQDNDGLKVVAAGGDTIRISGSVSAASGSIESTTVGDTVTLISINDTEWVATSTNGTWTVT